MIQNEEKVFFMNEQPEKIQRISVSIGGISYQLVSRENETYTREIARKADETIRQIVQQHPSLSTMQAIILSMVNTLDALTKVSAVLEEAKRELETIGTKSAKEMESIKFKMTKAQHELFTLRDTDFELKKEVLRINELNKQLELEIASLRQHKTDEKSNDYIDEDEISAERENPLAYDPDIDFFEGLNPKNNAEYRNIIFTEIRTKETEGSANSTESEDSSESESKTESESEEIEDLAELEENEEIEELEGLEENEEIVEWADVEEDQNPFAVPMNFPNKTTNTNDSFSGFKQPSLEDLFSE